MNVIDRLAEPVTSLAASGNPLTLLEPRQRAVMILLGAGAGLDATTVANLLGISRETLYEDRRRAWQTLTPIVPESLMRAYQGRVAPWSGRRASSPSRNDNRQ